MQNINLKMQNDSLKCKIFPLFRKEGFKILKFYIVIFHFDF